MAMPTSNNDVQSAEANEPTIRPVRADTRVSTSSNYGRPDSSTNVPSSREQCNGNQASLITQSKPSNRVYNGVRVRLPTMDNYRANDRAKREPSRTSSTCAPPSTKFVNACIRWSDTASSRSIVSTTMKSNSDITPEDSPSSSRFDSCNTLESGYASENVQFSNNPAPVLEPMSMSSRIPRGAVDIRNGQYMPYKMLNNSRSTSIYTSSTDSQSHGKCVRSVKLADKKFVCGYNKHCDCPIKSNSSCINKTAEPQVPFPRSNRASMHLGKLINHHENGKCSEFDRSDPASKSDRNEPISEPRF